jgi:hypothetical protein
MLVDRRLGGLIIRAVCWLQAIVYLSSVGGYCEGTLKHILPTITSSVVPEQQAYAFDRSLTVRTFSRLTLEGRRPFRSLFYLLIPTR